MPEDIVQETGGLRFRLMKPELLRAVTGGVPAVRFNVRIEHELTGDVLFDILGFRILKGRVVPPSRKVGQNWYQMTLLHPAAQYSLEKRVKAWEAEFPSVEFPL